MRAKAARLVEAVLEAPGVTSADDRRAAFVARADDAALAWYVDAVRRHAQRITDAEAIHAAFMFNTINRIADALGFEHRSDPDRRRGAGALRRLGYHLPAFLLRPRAGATETLRSSASCDDRLRRQATMMAGC